MNFLAIRANGELGWITIGCPFLATQCLYRRTRNRTLNDLVFLDIVGKFLVVTVVEIRCSLFGEDAAELF